MDTSLVTLVLKRRGKEIFLLLKGEKKRVWCLVCVRSNVRSVFKKTNCARAHTHTHAHTHARAHTHTHTHTHTQVELALGMLFGEDSKGVAGLERASKSALNRCLNP